MAYRKLAWMLVPLAGRILHSQVDRVPGAVMESTTGGMQNASPEAKDAAVLLHLEERNSVKLTEASIESRPAAANRR